MEEKRKQKNNKLIEHMNEKVVVVQNVSNIICKQIENSGIYMQENITNIDLSGRNIETLDDFMKLPENLMQLNLSHNKLIEVSSVILNLENLLVLNLSHNSIKYFDDRPKFCDTVEQLDISYNHLAGPPFWIWAESPQKLTRLDLSNNSCLTNSFTNVYFQELIQYSTQVTEIDLHNCKLNKFTNLITTFPKAESITLGSQNYACNTNSLIELPFQGLDKCFDLKRLIVCNTHIYTVSPNIEKYKNLVELNLAFNELNGLPNEFCNLENLEICVLSGNKLLYLPEDIHKLKKLVKLYLDSNELCIIPEMLCELSNLKTLDLYDNHLNEASNTFGYLEELDLAQNYFEEPENLKYLEKKEKLRLVNKRRYDGRKHEVYKSDDYEAETEDDEELYEILHNGSIEEIPVNPDPPSSPEDWDSDDYWVPFYQYNTRPPIQSPWLTFVKQKMKEGNFCPMDAHPVSVVETVRYQRLCNPQVNYESDGQFDDYSSDES